MLMRLINKAGSIFGAHYQRLGKARSVTPRRGDMIPREDLGRVEEKMPHRAYCEGLAVLG
jgi:hypothetical protein